MRFQSILVVCVGNICRSPTGERLLRNALPNKIIASAGVAAMVGHEADATASEVAIDHGVSLEHHLARQLTREICAQHDLILVMEQKHIDAVTRIAPEARGKTMLYGHWIKREIPDPYRQSREAFEFAYQLLSEATNAWATKLIK